MPTWEGFLIPTLRAMEDGKTRNRRAIPPVVADNLNLPHEQRKVVIASGEENVRQSYWLGAFISG